MSAAQSKNVKTWDARRQRFDEMFSMCLDGKTLSEIGEHFGISKQAVSGFLRCNANPKEFEIIQECFNKRLTGIWREEEIVSALQSGLTCSKVAEVVGCHVSTVKRVSARRKKAQA